MRSDAISKETNATDYPPPPIVPVPKPKSFKKDVKRNHSKNKKLSDIKA